ncbi:SMI1/KNR4 family protein [Paenibacillus chibensis]|uniref:SMI1/KNR4 family protein n=1 Tax=Paenibacillus chibensis TaxID=59846 RepID=UPI000FDA6D96|nr:SMI1/KNR4 family protein [Paenibacillus chibensis]MEC0373418.1 SMI1/KNR4 family protein [Paenibacillus chibensis]
MERDTRARKNKMTNSFLKYFKHEITPDSSIDINIQVIETDLGFTLPDDYKEMIKELNGFEGFINHAYIVFWPVSELIELNEEYGVGEFAPGILYFNSIY